MAAAKTKSAPYTASHQNACMLATMIIDYALGYLYFRTIYSYASGYNYTHDILACFRLFLLMLPITEVLVFKDNLYIYLFPTALISHKKSAPHHKPTSTTLYYHLKTRLITIGSLAVLVYYGLVEVPRVEPSQLLPFALYCQFEAFLGGLFRDAIGMNLFHRWAHSSVEAYKHHKVHHTFTTGITVYTVFYFDVMDLLLENSSGAAVVLALRFLILGKAGILYTLLLELWLNGAVHSTNPLACCFLNPVLDLAIKPALAHNIHHITPDRNMVVFPWHHFTKKGYKRDVDTYNKYMDTNVH
ncbi:hypothetical protein HDV05_002740 [Chytridiales sp. JEL 0842]|nr:hypothetical protein HDV05_002740 [Chytridiales sp. JEL 0842]